MPTHAQLASRLLRDAATFFRTVGAQNAPLTDTMNDNAEVYERIAELLERDPLGVLDVDEDDGGRA